MPNKAFKPLAMLARTFGTPRALAHGFAIVAQRPLRTKRRLTGRYAKKVERAPMLNTWPIRCLG